MTKYPLGKPPSGTLVGPESDWQRRIDAARGGDTAELSEMVEELRAYLELVSERELDKSLRVKTAPSDLVQQTLLEATQGIAKFRGQTYLELQTWLLKILRNNLVDATRSFRNAKQRDYRREIPLAQLASEPSANQRTASSIYRRVEVDQQLDAAIAQLPEHYRTVILLRHFEDLPWSEIGNRLEISADAARKLWARSLARLREKLQIAGPAGNYERTNQTTRIGESHGSSD